MRPSVLIRKICVILYRLLGMHLPSIKNSYGDVSSRFRYVLAKGFMEHCGKCVNIQPKAIIASRTRIGDYSGIGSPSLIQGGGNYWKSCDGRPRSLYIYSKP